MQYLFLGAFFPFCSVPTSLSFRHRKDTFKFLGIDDEVLSLGILCWCLFLPLRFAKLSVATCSFVSLTQSGNCCCCCCCCHSMPFNDLCVLTFQRIRLQIQRHMSLHPPTNRISLHCLVLSCLGAGKWKLLAQKKGEVYSRRRRR